MFRKSYHYLMKRKYLMLIPLFVLFGTALFAGCYRFVSNTPSGEELEIVEAEVVLGGSKEKPVVNYEITLQNNGDKNVTVEWVRPSLEEDVQGLLAAGNDLTLKVAKVIPAGETLSLKGKFVVKANKKSALTKLEPIIGRFTVVTRRSLPMPVPEEESDEAGKETAKTDD